jgi:SRSO17 transposase
MNDLLDPAGVQRLESYFDGVARVLGDVRRKASFATYAMGLLLEGERKSVEPIAARTFGDPVGTARAQDRVLNFLVDSTWSDVRVRQYATRYGLAALTSVSTIAHWIVDDTGFLKQGKHSVGVQRQYTGSAGKTTNCQIGVSLSIATPTDHLPIDFELYVPESWMNDPARRKEARIPEEAQFRTKLELALVMIDRALEFDVPKGVVLADSAYGDSSEFREALRGRGLDYAVGVRSATKVWRIDSLLRRRGEALSVHELALQLGPKKFRQCTWRDGTSDKLRSRFARLRVVPFHDDGWDPAHREDVWLLIEWEAGEKQPNKFVFATMPRRISMKRLVRTVKERYRTERAYEDLKGEFGLDHYEGRRYPGWNHHISCVLVCYAFILGERLRAFPPSAARTRQSRPHRLAA